MSKAIEINNLSKRYSRKKRNLRSLFIKKSSEDQFYALQNINLSIEKGDAVGVIGPNGSGKSTLLKIISRITEPTDGNILVNGKVVSILEVGLGFQQELSGYENIFLSGYLYGLSKKEIESKIDQIIDFFGFKDFIHQAVKTYSSGMYARLAFSIVNYIDADIYIYDEVLTVGDSNFSRKAIEQIKKKIDKQKTIIFVTHEINILPIFCNKTIVLDKSKMIFYGDSIEAISQYNSRFNSIESDPIYKEKNEIISNFKSTIDIIDLQNLFKISDIKINCTDKIIKMNDDFEISMLVQKYDNETKLDISILFFDNNEGTPILASSTGFRANGKEIVEKGTYNISCKIPGNILNAGSYSVSIASTKNLKKTVSHPNVFQIIIYKDTDSPFTLAKTKALANIVPEFDWEINKSSYE